VVISNIILSFTSVEGVRTHTSALNRPGFASPDLDPDAPDEDGKDTLVDDMSKISIVDAVDDDRFSFFQRGKLEELLEWCQT
jgi:hypothetical protein